MNFFRSAMVFRKYSRDVKLVVVKMCLDGKSLAEINDETHLTVSPESLLRWKALYERTREVIRDPSLYDP